MSLVSIRAALDTRLAAMSPALDTAWENDGYKPVIGTAWQRATLLPAVTVPAGVGSSTAQLWTGLYQVSLFYPAKVGPGAAATRAGLVLAQFSRGTSLTAGAVSVRLEQPYVRTGLQEPDWYHLPVIVPWFSYVG